MRVLGIDPGYGRVGWGIVDQVRGEWVHVAHGCIETFPDDSFLDRLLTIHHKLERIITRFSPTHAAVEQLYFYNNAKTAMDVGQARGVILLTLSSAQLPITELTPLQVKQGLTGYGQADKKQIQDMIARLLGVRIPPSRDDAADALAVAMVGGNVLR
jgi:crossover junction endodeoxyribonuclease RuvC